MNSETNASRTTQDPLQGPGTFDSPPGDEGAKPMILPFAGIGEAGAKAFVTTALREAMRWPPKDGKKELVALNQCPLQTVP